MKNDLKGKMQEEFIFWQNVDFAFTKIYKKVSCKWQEGKKGWHNVTFAFMCPEQIAEQNCVFLSQKGTVHLREVRGQYKERNDIAVHI